MSLVTTSVGYSVMAPPGVSNPVMEALRQAFDATMNDPGFLESAKKCCVDLDPAAHTVVERAVAKAVNSPKALLDRFIKATAP
jgi:hypothetical protein